MPFEPRDCLQASAATESARARADSSSVRLRLFKLIYMAKKPIPLSFSRRTMASIAVFTCLFAARQAQTLTQVAATIGALNFEHAQLFRIYRQLRHQDVANQANVLNSIIAQAVIVVGSLNGTVSGMSEPDPLPEDMFELPNIQIAVANALTSLKNAQLDQ
jgi:hypothetical protein